MAWPQVLGLDISSALCICKLVCLTLLYAVHKRTKGWTSVLQCTYAKYLSEHHKHIEV